MTDKVFIVFKKKLITFIAFCFLIYIKFCIFSIYNCYIVYKI